MEISLGKCNNKSTKTKRRLESRNKISKFRKIGMRKVLKI